MYSRFCVVVFVQHLLTKRPPLPRMRLSFVACSELFGSYRNCDGGGHPEVVPLGGSLKSLALSGSVRRREATERVSRDKGTNLRVFHPADPEPSLQSNLEVNMKMVKSLILGSAAGLIAMSGAQAADLPVKAKPVEYVKVCSLYGAGFFYIPGTDTCIKIGGAVRVQAEVNAGSGGVPVGFGNSTEAGQGRATRFDTNDVNFRNRIYFSVDARQQTEYGTLRTYFRFGAQQTTPTDSVGGAVFW